MHSSKTANQNQVHVYTNGQSNLRMKKWPTNTETFFFCSGTIYVQYVCMYMNMYVYVRTYVRTTGGQLPLEDMPVLDK